MHISEIKAMWWDLDDEAYRVMNGALWEYATEEDPLDNFKTIARLLGVTPRQVLLVYFLKHVLSFVRGGTIREPMRGRRIDMMNYIRLDELMEQEESK